MSKFWTFDQTNSGGSFDFQPQDGITHYVIIEANDSTHAMQRALDIGLYFNGCDDDVDCPCCGDRWNVPYNDDGDDAPTIYDKPASEATGMRWMPEGKETCVHYLDGRREWYGVKARSAL